MVMICKNINCRILVEYDREERERVETRIIHFPNNSSHLITQKVRVWKWYDNYSRRYPWKAAKLKRDLLNVVSNASRRKNTVFGDELNFGFRWFMIRINRSVLEHRGHFLEGYFASKTA